MTTMRINRYIPDSAKLSRKYLELLEQIGDTCAQKIQIFLKQYLHMEMEVEWKGVSTKSYKDFISGLPSSCSIQILKEPSFQYFSLLVHNTLTASAIIERLLGADNVINAKEAKFTNIEVSLVSRLNFLLLKEIQKALEDIGELSWTIRKHETNPLLASVLADKDDVLVLAFEIGGPLPRGFMLLCISAIDAITYLEKNKIMNTTNEERIVNQDITEHLQKIPLRVSIRLGDVDLTYGDLINLTPGDVIKLGRPANYSALLYIKDTAKFVGQIGNYNNHWAFLIDKEGDQYEQS